MKTLVSWASYRWLLICLLLAGVAISHDAYDRVQTNHFTTTFASIAGDAPEVDGVVFSHQQDDNNGLRRWRTTNRLVREAATKDENNFLAKLPLAAIVKAVPPAANKQIHTQPHLLYVYRYFLL